MRALRFTALVIIVVALVANAVIHLRLAGPFDAVTGTLLSQGMLFRIQAVVNVATALLLLIIRSRWTAVLAGVVAVGGLGLVVITTIVPLDLTMLGLPLLFEPIWYSDKIASAVAQAIALAAAVVVCATSAPRAEGGTRSVRP